MADAQEFTLPPLDERPLVTFALFAYNQEEYIREAVEGAFAQTYSPLEIILSDDCSSDRTYQIMQGMAEAYRGPHRVAVRRNEKNLGICGHVGRVFCGATGRLIVVAAGDDISLSERVETIAEYSKRNPAAFAFSSGWIDMETREHRNKKVPQCLEDVLQWRGALNGATAAYLREIVEKFPPLDMGGMIEDGTFALRAFLLGGSIQVIDKALVEIRPNVGVTRREGHNSIAFNLPSVRQLNYSLLLYRQWRLDLSHAGLKSAFSQALPRRVETIFQYHLATKRRVPLRIVLLMLRNVGAKKTAFCFLAWRYPDVLSKYYWLKRKSSEILSFRSRG